MAATIRANGDANSYTLLQGDRWLASVLLNGELLPGAQEAIMRRLASAVEDPSPGLPERRTSTAAILAGLRLLQRHDTLPPDIDDILTDGGSLPRIGEGDIDALCDALNSSVDGVRI